MTWLDLRLVPEASLLTRVWRRLSGSLQSRGVHEQLRDAEERYRGLVESLPLATYVDRTDESTGTAWVSPQIETITSYSPDEWMANAALFVEILHPEDCDRVLAAKAQARASGEPFAEEYRLIRRDRSVVWIRDSSVLAGSGRSTFARGFVVDITARREAELHLEEQNEQLRQLDSLKDEFIALVSHELRTPLTSIRGYLELLGENADVFTDEQNRFLETIDRNAQRLQRVVGDLLFAAQVEAGKLTLEQGEVDISQIVDDAVQTGQPGAAAKSISLVAELSPVPVILGDHARLAQVLDNFVSNAIKFTPEGGSVTLTTRTLPGEIEIVIADTGMGIPASELPHLFKRFFRTERATANAIPGTGLSLAIARAIVSGHGGRIRVQSTAGEGTTFRIILPG